MAPHLDEEGHRYRLRLLGGLSIEAFGCADPPASSQRKGLALLALLAMAGNRGLTREKLFAYLWPESDGVRASNALSQLLFRLRRELDSDVIVGNGELRLNTGVSSDAGEFRAFLKAGSRREAVGLYGGPFLDGFHLHDAPEFERWAEDERARFARELALTLEQLATDAQHQGDHVQAIQWWRRCVAEQPLSTRIARACMESLVAAGDLPAAIQIAEYHAACVARDLETGADASILAYADELRRTLSPRGGIRRVVTAGTDAAVFGPAPDAPSRARRDPRSVPFLVLATTAAALLLGAWPALSTLARPGTSPDLVAVEPFGSPARDTSLQTLGATLTHATARFLGGIAPVRVTDSTASREAPGLVVHGTILGGAGDSVMVMLSLTRDSPGGDRTVHQLPPVRGTASGPEQLTERVRLQVAGAVAAAANTRLGELAFEQPGYEAYLAYEKAVDAMVNDIGPSVPHLRAAAALDSTFMAPRLLLLEMAGGALRDSVAMWLEARRTSLSRRDQLLMDALRARGAHDLDQYYHFAEQLRALGDDHASVLWRLAHAALQTRRYRLATTSLHDLRGSRDWHAELWSAWQIDLDAHHMLGEFRRAIAEWRPWHDSLPHEETICVWGVRQYAALGDAAGVDSLVARCVSGDIQAERGRMGRRTHLEDELLRWAGREFLVHGHDAAGQRALRRALDVERRHFSADSSANNGWLAAQLMQDWPLAHALMREDIARGGACAERDRRQICSTRGRTRFAVAAAGAGDTATALATLEWMSRQYYTDSLFKVERAKILLAVGRTDDALRSLREAVRHVSPAHFLHANADLLPLRSDRRFQALLAPR